MTRWTAWFRFDGEIGRRAYALGWAATIAALFVGGVSLFLVGYLTLLALEGAGAIPAALLPALHRMAVPLTIVLVAIPYLWVQTALAAKRARQAGLHPAVLIPAWWALVLLDTLVLDRLIAARFIPPFDGMTPVGGGVSLMIYAALLAWPGKGRKDAPPAGPSRSGPARATFGLRG